MGNAISPYTSTVELISGQPGGGWGGSIPTIPPVIGSIPLLLNLTSAGRVDFYLLNSELTAAGTHKFYVCRTHGTAGAVSVDYLTTGDTHTQQSGTLTWADGDASLQSIEIIIDPSDVTTHNSSGLGEHRIVMTLSNPTNGLALQRLSNTRAYGIIDDGSMIADDTNAWFTDFDAGVDGVGTTASPFNNFDSLRVAQDGSHKRYCYGKGTQVPADSVTGSIIGINLDPSGISLSGTSETDRTYFMAWPGFTWDVDGDGGLDTAGFYSDTDADYITFKGIGFSNLDTSSLGTITAQCFAWWFRTSNVAPVIEHCTIDGIISGATSGTAAVYDDGNSIGLNLWRSSFSNISKVNLSQPNAYEKYDGGSAYIQSCTFNECHVYQKDSPENGETGMTLRHNITTNTFRLSGLGTNNQGNYHVVQGNLIDGALTSDVMNLRFDGTGTEGVEGIKHWVVGNIFKDCGSDSSTFLPLNSQDTASDFILFNNIWYQGTGVSRFSDDGGTDGIDKVEYMDYDHAYNISLAGSQLWRLDPESYATVLALQTGTPFEANITEGDPLFTNIGAYDVTLGGGSPCLATGVTNTDKGVYITGDEQLGA